MLKKCCWVVFAFILFSSSFARASDTEFNHSSGIEGSGSGSSDNEGSSEAEQKESVASKKNRWSIDQVKVLREKFKEKFNGIYTNGGVNCTISKKDRSALAEVLKKTPGKRDAKDITEMNISSWVTNEKNKIRKLMSTNPTFAALRPILTASTEDKQAFYEKFKELKEKKKKRKSPSSAAVHPMPFAPQPLPETDDSNSFFSSSVASGPTAPERIVRRRIDPALSVPSVPRRPVPVGVQSVSSVSTLSPLGTQQSIHSGIQTVSPYSSAYLPQQQYQFGMEPMQPISALPESGNFSLVSSVQPVYVVELPRLAVSATGAPPVILLKFPTSDPSRAIMPSVYFQPYYSAPEAAPQVAGQFGGASMPYSSSSSSFQPAASSFSSQSVLGRSSSLVSASSYGSLPHSLRPCVNLPASPLDLSSLPITSPEQEETLSPL